MNRYALAVVFTVEADDPDDAYDLITDAIDHACLDEGDPSVRDDAAFSPTRVPADYEEGGETHWSIGPLEWNGRKVM